MNFYFILIFYLLHLYFFQNQCIIFYCPYYLKAQNHTCYDRAFNAREKLLEFSVNIKINSPFGASSRVSESMSVVSESMSIWDKMTSLVLETLNTNSSCELFDSAFSILDSGSTWNLLIIRVEAPNGSCDNLLASFREKPLYSIDYEDGPDIMQMDLRLFKNLTGVRGSIQPLPLTTFQHHVTSQAVVSLPILNCPHVILKLSEVCKLVSKEACSSQPTGSVFSKLVHIATDLDETMYSVCVEDFLGDAFVSFAIQVRYTNVVYFAILFRTFW